MILSLSSSGKIGLTWVPYRRRSRLSRLLCHSDCYAVYAGHEDDHRNFDLLLREARKLAEREGITLRALVERGLRRVMVETKPGAPFKLRRAGSRGKGLRAYMRGAPWGKLGDLAYEGCGA
jgi:hypothetical protein